MNKDDLIDDMINMCQRVDKRDSELAYNRLKLKIDNKRRRDLLLKTLSYAAVVLLFVGVDFIYDRLINENRSDYVTMITNNGMRGEFKLPDGSSIYLNSGSKVIYPSSFNDKDERIVKLYGEGYFSVEKDKKRPFIVNVGDSDMRVKVYGTQFNISAYDNSNYINTTLVSGSVAVEVKSDDGFSQSMIVPSQRARYNKADGGLDIENVDTTIDTSWREGVLIFQDTPMLDVINKLSVFYNVDILVDDNSIYDYSFSGTFRNRQLDQVLKYLKLTLDIDFTVDIVSNDNSTIVKLLKR